MTITLHCVRMKLKVSKV